MDYSEKLQKIKEMIKPNDKMKKDLLFVVNHMPKGYLAAIKNKIGEKYQKPYISQFFRGKFMINLENECILDAALEILEEEKMKEQRIRKKINEVIN